MTQTALLPHQKANVAILLGLLAALPDDKYNHNTFGFRNSLDFGCAMGLAYANRGLLDLKAVETIEEPTFIDKLLGRTTRTIKVKADDYGTWEKRGATHSFAEEQFGSAMWERVFDCDAYGIDPDNVTKQMVMERLAEFA